MIAAPVDHIRGGLVVSCQAPPGHPLHDSHVLALLARCAEIGGAKGVRVNGPDDVRAAKQLVDVPIIGLYKLRRADSRDLITPGFDYAAQLARAGADVIAVEATAETVGDPVELIRRVRAELGLPVMADVSTTDEGMRAWDAGAELVGTTLAGYTPYSDSGTGPDIELVRNLSRKGVRTVAEGRYATVRDVAAALDAGAWSVVIGSAITDALTITRNLVQAMAIQATTDRDTP